MIQFYFLSILFNALSGYMLITDGDRGEESPSPGIQFLINNGTFRMVLGILTLITGLLKLLSSVQGDVPVVGDLIPSLVGFVMGFILVFDYFRKHSSPDVQKYEKIEAVLAKNRRLIGFVALASAALHFMFPQVLLL
jgi:hypothetical protein